MKGLSEDVAGIILVAWSLIVICIIIPIILKVMFGG